MANVMVPKGLLTDIRITDKDRKLWMTMRHDYLHTPACNLYKKVRLAEHTALSRTTIYRSLERLARAGWYDLSKPEVIINSALAKWSWIDVPDELLFCRDISPRDLVICCLLRDPQYQKKSHKEFTFKTLAEYVGVCVKTAKRAITALVKASWLNVRQENQKSPVHFDVDISPSEKYYQRQINLITNRLTRAKWRGEALALSIVEALTDAEYWFTGRPRFLANPETGELMEIDIWFPEYRVAIEFNGQQHTSETSFASQEDVAKQKRRDVLKEKLLKDNGITLIVLTAVDLSVEAIARKLRGLVPLRNLKQYRKLVQYLNTLGRNYQNNLNQAQFQGA